MTAALSIGVAPLSDYELHWGYAWRPIKKYRRALPLKGAFDRAEHSAKAALLRK